jgi:hypothetical protein
MRLEHSYSWSAAPVPDPNGSGSSLNIAIPKLSAMLCVCQDPDIRPLSKIERIYLYADLSEKVELPGISESRRVNVTLPMNVLN